MPPLVVGVVAVIRAGGGGLPLVVVVVADRGSRVAMLLGQVMPIIVGCVSRKRSTEAGESRGGRITTLLVLVIPMWVQIMMCGVAARKVLKRRKNDA